MTTEENKKPVCPTCKEESVQEEIGTASGRPHFRCANGHEWREKNPAAVALGSLGGKARTANMTPEELSKQAQDAVNARWRNHKLKQNKPLA